MTYLFRPGPGRAGFKLLHSSSCKSTLRVQKGHWGKRKAKEAGGVTVFPFISYVHQLLLTMCVFTTYCSLIDGRAIFRQCGTLNFRDETANFLCKIAWGNALGLDGKKSAQTPHDLSVLAGAGPGRGRAGAGPGRF